MKDLKRGHHTPVKWMEIAWILQDGMILDESNNTMLPEQMKERNEKNKEENNIFYHKLIWKASSQRRIERSCWKIDNEKNNLVVGLWKTSQHLRWKPATNGKNLLAWGKPRDENFFHHEDT